MSKMFPATTNPKQTTPENMTLKLTWTKSEDEPGLHIGHLTACDDPKKIPAEIATIKASDEGKAFLTRAVNLVAEQDRAEEHTAQLRERLAFLR